MLCACGLLQQALACAWVNIWTSSMITEQQGYNGEYLSQYMLCACGLLQLALACAWVNV